LSTATPTPGPGSSNHQIQVGPGFSDVSPHQVVRTSTNVLYAVVPTCDSYPSCPSNSLRVYRADQPGTPSSFTEQDAAHRPVGGIGSTASAIDGVGQIHVAWIDRAGSGHANYATFSTLTNQWAPVTLLQATGWTSFGQGEEGVALALDVTGVAHVAWNGVGADGLLHVYYANRTGGTWSSPLQVDDVPLASGRQARHPTIAFSPIGGLVVAWLDGSFNYTPDGTIHVRVRGTLGTWSASVAIPDAAMTSIDNGPALLITADGVEHLVFDDTGDQIRYWYNAGAGWRGDLQPPAQITHDPAIGPDGVGGVFIYGHGTPVNGIAGHGNNLYSFHKPVAGAWGPWTLYTTGSLDSSVSTRWSQFFHFFPLTVDILFWSDAYPNVLYVGVN
jgi:hypothetical protein